MNINKTSKNAKLKKRIFKSIINLFFIATLILLTGCNNSKLIKGEYIKKYKAGNLKIIIENDSILKYETNISMLFLNVEGKYKRIDKKLLFLLSYNTIEKSYDTLPFSTQTIQIKNNKKLVIDGIIFKYRKRNS